MRSLKRRLEDDGVVEGSDNGDGGELKVARRAAGEKGEVNDEGEVEEGEEQNVAIRRRLVILKVSGHGGVGDKGIKNNGLYERIIWCMYVHLYTVTKILLYFCL